MTRLMHFSYLTARLQPLDVVTIMDHLHTLIDEAYSNRDIIMEHTSGGCIAASKLVGSLAKEPKLFNCVLMGDSFFLV